MGFSIAQSTPVYKDTNNQISANNRNTKSNALNMDSFLQLMAAQIQNQDVLNPSSNEDYIAQMVQMTMIQAINDMMDMSMASYASSMIGKNVVLAEVNGSEITQVEGIVTGVSIYGGDPVLHVNGKDYSLSQIMVVGKKAPEQSQKVPGEKEPPVDETKQPEESGTTGNGSTTDNVSGGGNTENEGAEGENASGEQA